MPVLILLLFIHCLLLLHLCEFCIGFLLCEVVIGVLSSLVNQQSRLLYLNCVVTLCVLCLLLTVQMVGLQSVSVAFPVHTYLLFGLIIRTKCRFQH